MNFKYQLLENERIHLTLLLDDDMTPLAQWLSDFNLQRLANPGVLMPMTAQDLLAPESWMSADRNSPNSYIFAIRVKKKNDFIGVVALSNINSQARHAAFGINIAHPDYRGQGYGQEATKTMLRYGFLELNLNRIWLDVFSYNERAIRLYENVGFVHEGREREMIYRDGQYHDSIKMGILRREWKK